MDLSELFGFSSRWQDGDVIQIELIQIWAVVDHDTAFEHDLNGTTILLGQVHQNILMAIRELGVLEDGKATAGFEESSIGQWQLPVDESNSFLILGNRGLGCVLVQTFHDVSPLKNELIDEQIRDQFPPIRPKAKGF